MQLTNKSGIIVKCQFSPAKIATENSYNSQHIINYYVSQTNTVGPKGIMKLEGGGDSKKRAE